MVDRLRRSHSMLVQFLLAIAATLGAATPIDDLRTILHRGDPALLQPVYDKLLSGQCITVLAIGGSVTCGIASSVSVHGKHGGHHEDDPKGKDGAWPAFLQILLNANFPCRAMENNK